nr:hypothetical protein CFP56_03340 [Quercus suber]
MEEVVRCRGRLVTLQTATLPTHGKIPPYYGEARLLCLHGPKGHRFVDGWWTTWLMRMTIREHCGGGRSGRDVAPTEWEESILHTCLRAYETIQSARFEQAWRGFSREQRVPRANDGQRHRRCCIVVYGAAARGFASGRSILGWQVERYMPMSSYVSTSEAITGERGLGEWLVVRKGGSTPVRIGEAREEREGVQTGIAGIVPLKQVDAEAAARKGGEEDGLVTHVEGRWGWLMKKRRWPLSPSEPGGDGGADGIPSRAPPPLVRLGADSSAVVYLSRLPCLEWFGGRLGGCKAWYRGTYWMRGRAGSDISSWDDDGTADIEPSSDHGSHLIELVWGQSDARAPVSPSVQDGDASGQADFSAKATGARGSVICRSDFAGSPESWTNANAGRRSPRDFDRRFSRRRSSRRPNDASTRGDGHDGSEASASGRGW